MMLLMLYEIDADDAAPPVRNIDDYSEQLSA